MGINLFPLPQQQINFHYMDENGVLSTNLWYFIPLVEGLVCMLLPFNARSRPLGCMRIATTFVPHMCYPLGTTKSEQYITREEKSEKRCRDGMPKNDTNKGRYKSEGKYTKPYPPLHLFTLQLHFSVRKMQGPQPPPSPHPRNYTASDGKLSRGLGTLYDIAVSCALPTQCQ